MMKKNFVALLFLVCALSAVGQSTTTEYLPNQNIENAPDIVTDESLFAIPLERGVDNFTQLSSYNFGAVRYLRRGYDYWQSLYTVNGVELRDAVSGRTYYGALATLRPLRGAQRAGWGVNNSANKRGNLGGTTDYNLVEYQGRQGSWVGASTSTKQYRYGLEVGSGGTTGNYGSVSYTVAATRRWGRDATIGGVYTDDGSVMVAVRKRIGQWQTLSLFASVKPREQGLRSATTQEAFELTGNNLYNPSWGYANGREVNTKVAGEFQPLVVASYAVRINEQTNITASVGGVFGRSYYTGLTWYDASNPYPDYWRNMPSHEPNQQIADQLREGWESGDPRVTQVDWDDMVRRNANKGADAIFVHENRVESGGSVQFVAALQHKLGPWAEINGGLRARTQAKRLFKQARNLLGAAYLIDTEQFLVDEGEWGSVTVNNIQTPDRKVGQGERFGYDYNIFLSQYSIFASADYVQSGVRASGAAELGRAEFRRRGNYEKELFPATASYGYSPRKSFATYTLRGVLGYSFSPRHNADIGFVASEDAPLYSNIFFDPQNSNHAIAHPTTAKTFATEANYNITTSILKLKLSGYFTDQRDDAEISRYYDDISSRFANAVISGIDRRYYGVELSGDFRLSSSLTVRFAASKSSSFYNSNPAVDLYNATNATTIQATQSSRIKGYKLGSTPQSVASVELRYSSPSRWTTALSVNHTADNHITISPERRTERVLWYARESPELFDQFVAQQRFADATTLNLFVSKAFAVGRHNVYALASVNNLLDNRNITYSGYEQTRMHKTTRPDSSVGYLPFDSKYLNAWGRTYYIALNYNF